MSKALAQIVDRHVAACVQELRAAVEAEIAAAVRALSPGVRVARAKRPKAARPRVKGSAPQKRAERAVASEPPQPVKRSTPSPKPRACSECDQPGHNARTCPALKRPVVAPPVDAAKAERFARLEAAAKARNGASA